MLIQGIDALKKLMSEVSARKKGSGREMVRFMDRWFPYNQCVFEFQLWPCKSLHSMVYLAAFKKLIREATAETMETFSLFLGDEPDYKKTIEVGAYDEINPNKFNARMYITVPDFPEERTDRMQFLTELDVFLEAILAVFQHISPETMIDLVEDHDDGEGNVISVDQIVFTELCENNFTNYGKVGGLTIALAREINPYIESPEFLKMFSIEQ